MISILLLDNKTKDYYPDVLELACTGLSNREIARRLNVKVRVLFSDKRCAVLLDKNDYEYRVRLKKNRDFDKSKMPDIKNMIEQGHDLFKISRALRIPLALLQASKEVQAMFKVYQDSFDVATCKTFDVEEAKALYFNGNTLEHIGRIFNIEPSRLLLDVEFMNYVESNVANSPAKAIDYETLGKLAALQCSIGEISNVMQLSYDRLREDAAVRVITEKREAGKASLRRMQWACAEKGNVQMLMFLGKQYLNQNDRGESEGTGQNVSFVLPVPIEKDSEWEETFK